MNNLTSLAKLIRYYILMATAEAGSGHVTSSLSAVELMTVLFFGGIFKTNLENSADPRNDRLIFSKGHASPLFYALYAAAGQLTLAELKTLRQFDSPLEGHPTSRFKFTEAATGSLGQGLGIGLGMALQARYLASHQFKTYVLLGDSEMSEGSIWEAVQLAAHYQLNNLIGIIDGNRLGQRGETLHGHDLGKLEKQLQAFNWATISVDGHDLTEIEAAFRQAHQVKDQPVMIIARTIKGKGVSFLEDQPDWHGKALRSEQLQQAVTELGEVDLSLMGEVELPQSQAAEADLAKTAQAAATQAAATDLTKLFDVIIQPVDGKLATRKAYGNALAKLGLKFPELVVLDAEVSNSTYAEVFQQLFPARFFEMYIAEQNMISTAVGLAQRGQIPFVSTFAAFLTRAFDQIRLAAYSQANLKIAGSHAGVSIGEDGSSQMGLEDIAMMRAVQGSVVLYPSDAVSTEKLMEKMAVHQGISYIRLTRADTPLLYDNQTTFEIGGCHELRKSGDDVITILAAGITLHEALKAYDLLQAEGISVRVIDLYSIKPLPTKELVQATVDTPAILTVEDHYPAGGMGEAVASFLAEKQIFHPIHSLAVTKMPRSGRPEQLLAEAAIDATAIVAQVKLMLKQELI